MSVSTALTAISSSIFLGLGRLSSTTSSSDTQKADFLSKLPVMSVNEVLRDVNEHFNNDAFQVMSNNKSIGIVVGHTFCPADDLIQTSFGNDRVIMSELTETELIDKPVEAKPATYDSYGRTVSDAVIEWRREERPAGPTLIKGSDCLRVVDSSHVFASSNGGINGGGIPPGGDVPTRPSQAVDINGVPITSPHSSGVPSNIAPLNPVYPSIVIPRHRIPRNLFTLNFIDTQMTPQQSNSVNVQVNVNQNTTTTPGLRENKPTELPKATVVGIRKEERVIYPKKRLTIIGEFYQSSPTEYEVRGLTDHENKVTYSPIIDYKSREEIVQQLRSKGKTLESLSTIFYGIGGCLGVYSLIDLCIKIATGRTVWGKKA